MKWIVKVKKPTVDPRFKDNLDKFMTNAIYKSAHTFIKIMTREGYLPAWTGQMRASMSNAASLVDVTITYNDREEPNRKGKTVLTGIPQGSAKFFQDNKEYGFSFRSWVKDLNRKNQYNYFEANEYFKNERHDRIRMTPWFSMAEAGYRTEQVILRNAFPVLIKLIKTKLMYITIKNVG